MSTDDTSWESGVGSDADGLLLPDEELVIRFRPAWRSYHGLFTLGLAVGIICYLTTSGLLLLLEGLLTLSVVCFRFRHLYIVTSRRAVSRIGLLGRTIVDIPLDRVSAVTIRQGVLDRILGVGDVVLVSAAEIRSHLVFRGVADPAAFRGKLRAGKS